MNTSEIDSKAPDLVLQLETLAANAWPAAEVAPLGGWRMRAAQGITRRANSVWPNGWEAEPALDARLDAVEQFYTARGLPAVYQICPAMQPSALDAALERRGYHAHSHTFVQTTTIQQMLELLPSLRHYPDYEVEVYEEFDPTWHEIYVAPDALSELASAGRREILERIAQPCGYVMVRDQGRPAAVGLGVAEDGWLGIFCMVTLPEFRRRGAARAALRTLAVWSQLYEVQHAYLQVMGHNAAAQALYASAGFVTAYQYHYREKSLETRGTK